ncbi:MAG TPA: hypothetical protein VGI33_00855 [Paenibacillus sp.]
MIKVVTSAERHTSERGWIHKIKPPAYPSLLTSGKGKQGGFILFLCLAT